jgi:hypothetical protein
VLAAVLPGQALEHLAAWPLAGSASSGGPVDRGSRRLLREAAERSLQPDIRRPALRGRADGAAIERPVAGELAGEPVSPARLEPDYLQGAGLVLLHPFLPALLERTGLTRGGEFLAERLRERAIGLLGYLVWGDRERPEYELILDKHLLGVPAERHVRRIMPEASEREEAERLLHAVIGHWAALKSTSADGLREGFLQREGRLARDDDKWVLTVAPAAQDVLLSRLPWGLGLVHLPWMPELLHVTWG